MSPQEVAGDTARGLLVQFDEGRLRDECLNARWFLTLADTRAKIEARRPGSDESRPHSAISHETSIEPTKRSGERPPT